MSISLILSDFKYFAEVGGIDIIQKNATQANDIKLSWDYMWRSFFAESNTTWTLIVYLASFIVSFCFLFFALSFVDGLLSGRLHISIDSLLWLFLVLILLSNNAKPIANFNLFVRDFTYDRVENIYQFNLIGTKVNEVITDILVAGDVKEEISVLFSRCDGISGTEQLECLIEVEEKAQEIIQEIEDKYKFLGWDLRGIARLKKRLADMSFEDKKKLLNPSLIGDREIINPFNLPVFISSLRIFLKNTQWFVLNGIEVAFLLTCFYGPIAAAASLVPLGTRPLTLWLFGILSLVSLIWCYTFAIAFVAMVVGLSETQLQSEVGFLMFLALGAPLIAWGLSKGGGGALLQAVTTTSLFITRATFGIISSILDLVL